MARYCEANDLRALVPDVYRDAALADSFGGANADPGMLDLVLSSACDEVDALISGRVRLPLPADAIPSKLRTAAALFAAETLCIRRGAIMPEALAAKVKWWRDWLSKVGEGDLRLAATPESDDEAAKSSAYMPADITARPAITGSRGLLGAIALLLSLGAALLPGIARAAVGHRTFSLAAPPDPATFSAVPAIVWERGESVTLELSGASLAPGQHPSWQVADSSNLWMDVESDGFSFHASPEAAAIPPGRYAGRVVVTNADASLVRVLAVQDIRVLPGASDLAPPGPASSVATTAWVEALAAALSNALHAADAEIEADIQDIAGNFARQAEDIAAIEEAVAAADSRIDGLWGVMPGGWRYPDYFSASARVGGEPVEAVALSTNTTINAVETLRQTTSVRGWILEAAVTRQSEFGKGVEWELGPGAEGLWRIEGGTVVPDGATFDNVETGDVFHATGRLGDFERNLELTVTGDNVSLSGQWQWDGWVNDSLIGDAKHSSELFADTYPNRTSHTRTWPEGYGSGTEHVPAGWAAESWLPWGNHFFSCVSYHTETPSGIAGGPYRPLTLVTPRHAICANHWKPTLGSNVYWVGASGAIYTNQVVAYKNLRGDLTVARLAEPMNAMLEDSEVVRDLMLPYLLPEDYENWFYGCEHGGAGCPGVPCVSLNWVEMAYMTYWRCAPALTAKRASDPRSFTVRARGAGTPHGRQAAAVGGDSGSPTFLLVNDELIDDPGDYVTERPVLLGCFHWASTPETGIGTAGGPIPLVGEVNAAIEEWGDEERAESAEACFEALGYEKYNPCMVPWH